MDTGAASTPAWLTRNLARPGKTRYAHSSGVQLRYLEWGSANDDRPGLLFIAGYRAHVRWWDFIAPIFADRFHVVVMEFSGSGDSGHRSHYRSEDYVGDILAVIEHSRLRRPIGIAHSYGGNRMLAACAEHPGLFERAVVVDAYIHFAEWGPLAEHPSVGSKRGFPDRMTGMARFRLSPEQPIACPALAEYIAAGSLREQDGVWKWKFDLNLPGGGPHEADGAALLQRVRIPVDIIWAQHSGVVNAECVRRMHEALPNAHPPIMVLDAHHHIMLDQPVAMIACLEALLS